MDFFDGNGDNTHGVWNEIICSKEYVGMTIIRFLDLCKNNFDNFPYDELLGLVFDKNQTEIMKCIAKQKQSERRQKQCGKIEIPKSIVKPPTVYCLYMHELSNINKTKQIKMSLSEMREQYKQLSKKEIEVLQEKVSKLKTHYDQQVKDYINEQIKTGKVQEPKPKKPLHVKAKLRNMAVKSLDFSNYSLTVEEKLLVLKKEKKITKRNIS